MNSCNTLNNKRSFSCLNIESRPSLVYNNSNGGPIKQILITIKTNEDKGKVAGKNFMKCTHYTHLIQAQETFLSGY